MSTQDPTHAELSVSASDSLKYKLGIGMQFRDKELEADFQGDVVPGLIQNMQIAGVFLTIGYFVALSMGLKYEAHFDSLNNPLRGFCMVLGILMFILPKVATTFVNRNFHILSTLFFLTIVAVFSIQILQTHREYHEVRFFGATTCVVLFAPVTLRGRIGSVVIVFVAIQVLWIRLFFLESFDASTIASGYPYVLMSTVAAYLLAVSIQSRERALFLERRRAKELQLAAEEATQAKTYFYSAASHDLRQPLAAMGLWVDQLSHAKSLDDAQRIGKAIKPAVTLMKEMFDSLLTSSSLEMGKYDISPTQFSLQELVQTIGSEYVDRAELKNIKLIVSAPNDIQVDTDYIYLSRLIRNLVHNAVTYTASGSVTVGYQLAPGEKVEVFVSDTGAGIPKHLHDKIFDEFFQVANPKRDRSKGLGLGLSIVRRICQALHLNLVLDSEPDKGSRFSFQLPIKA